MISTIIEHTTETGKVEYEAKVKQYFLFIPYWQTVKWYQGSNELTYGSGLRHNTLEGAYFSINKHFSRVKPTKQKLF